MSKPIVAMLLACVCGVVSAQAPKSAAPATYVTAGDLADALKSAPNQAATVIDRPVRVMNTGGQNLGVAIIQRTTADTGALVHDKIDEFYSILVGGGPLLTGGTLVNAKPNASSLTIGPGSSGTGIEGGENRRVAVGDVIFIPAGTPHMFSQLDGTIRYLTYRVDPAHVLGLK